MTKNQYLCPLQLAEFHSHFWSYVQQKERLGLTFDLHHLNADDRSEVMMTDGLYLYICFLRKEYMISWICNQPTAKVLIKLCYNITRKMLNGITEVFSKVN